MINAVIGNWPAVSGHATSRPVESPLSEKVQPETGTLYGTAQQTTASRE